MRFDFKRGFGWSELIAGIALILSIIVAIDNFIPEKPKLKIHTETLASGIFDDTDGSTKLFSFSKAIITNDGDKSVTYHGIKQHKEFGLIMFLKTDGRFENNANVSYMISDMPDNFTIQDIERNPSVLRKIEDKGLDHLFFQNKSIEPGESVTITLIAIFNIFKLGGDYKTIFFSPKLLFSDNSELELFGAGDLTRYKKYFK